MFRSKEENENNTTPTEDIGIISPGKEVEKRIPVSASLDIPDGTVTFSVQTKEARGYDARPEKLVLETRHLDKPALAITSVRLNDAKLGLASGDGDGLPENEETIEVIAFVKNQGVGEALDVGLNLASINSGLEIVQGNISIGSIAAQQTKEGKLVFRIPRVFSTAQLNFELRAEDKNGVSKVARKFTEAFGKRAPVLAYDYRILDSRGVQVDKIANGKRFAIELSPRNDGATDARIDFREREKVVGTIQAGTNATAKFNFFVMNSATPGTLPINLRITQADGFDGIVKIYSYDFNEARVIPDTVKGKEEKRPPKPLNKPPSVVIVSPSQGSKLYRKSTTLEILVTDDKPLLNLEPEIRVNGKRQTVEESSRGIELNQRIRVESAGKIRLARMVHLDEGDNTIQITVYDSDNEIGRDEIKVTYVTERTDIYAVVVGISRYQNTDVNNLRFADKDAQSFYDFLRSPAGGSVPGDHIKLLLNEKATHAEVLKNIDETLKRAFENDLVILYFANHGVPDSDRRQLYFLAHDSDPNNMIGTVISQLNVEFILSEKVKSNMVVMFADACHSGAFISSPKLSTRSGPASVINKLLSEIAKAKNGLAIITASRAAESSLESEEWGGGYGVFTYYLLKGLKGEADQNVNGTVTIQELHDYVYHEVAKATRGDQNPNIIDRGYDRNLPLAVVR